MRPDAFITAIEAAKAEHATASMRVPIERTTPSDYARAIGFYAGLDHAKGLWLQTLRDDLEKDKRL